MNDVIIHTPVGVFFDKVVSYQTPVLERNHSIVHASNYHYRTGKWPRKRVRWPFHMMEAGQYFFIPRDKEVRVRAAAHYWQRQHGGKIVCTVIGDYLKVTKEQ